MWLTAAARGRKCCTGWNRRPDADHYYRRERRERRELLEAVGVHLCKTTLRRAKLRLSGGGIEIVSLVQSRAEDPQGVASEDSVFISPAPGEGAPESATERLEAGPTKGERRGGYPLADTPRHVASMPASDVMSRCWTLPDTDEKKMRQMVANRLEADLPVAISELTWGYRTATVRERASQDATPHRPRQVLAQAARVERVAACTSLLAEAGVAVDALTTEAEALGALYRHGLAWSGSEGVDKAAGWQVLVVVTPDPIRAATSPVGPASQPVCDSPKSLSHTWRILVVCDDMVHSLRCLQVEPDRLELAARQCQQSIEAYVPRHDVRRVLWCAPPELAGARDLLAERLDVVVEPVRSAKHLANVDGTEIGAEQLATFGPAIGLALAGLFEHEQLIRLDGRAEPSAGPRGLMHSSYVQRIIAQPWRWTVAAAALLVLAAVVHVTAVGLETRKMRSLTRELAEAGSPMAALQPKIRAMQRLRTYRIDVELIAANLANPIPNSIVITSIQLSRGRRFVVKGIAKSPKAIFELVNALREGDLFTAVTLERTEPARGGGFTISAELVGVNTFPSYSPRGRR